MTNPGDAPDREQSGRPGGASVDMSALSERYLQALLQGDRRAALAVVLEQGLGGGVPVPELLIEVIQRAQREVGLLWEQNRISVAQEHMATSLSQLVVSHLYPHLPRAERNGKKVVVASVEGEQHEMGARLGADFFEMAGYDVRLVGPNCPVGSLVRLVESERADLLGLSATLVQHAAALRRTVEQVRASRGDNFPIVVGGALMTAMPELAGQLNVLATGTRADVILDLCRQRTGW